MALFIPDTAGAIRGLAAGLGQQRQQAQAQANLERQFRFQQEQADLTRQAQEQERNRKNLQAELGRVEKQTANPKLAESNPDFFDRLVARGNEITTQLFPGSPNISGQKVRANLDQWRKDNDLEQFYIKEFGEGSQEHQAILNEILPNYVEEPAKREFLERKIEAAQAPAALEQLKELETFKAELKAKTPTLKTTTVNTFDAAGEPVTQLVNSETGAVIQTFKREAKPAKVIQEKPLQLETGEIDEEGNRIKAPFRVLRDEQGKITGLERIEVPAEEEELEQFGPPSPPKPETKPEEVLPTGEKIALKSIKQPVSRVPKGMRITLESMKRNNKGTVDIDAFLEDLVARNPSIVDAEGKIKPSKQKEVRQLYLRAVK
jgi:hypothetical protein